MNQLYFAFTIGRAVAAYVFTRVGGFAASTQKIYRQVTDVDEKKAGFFFDKWRMQAAAFFTPSAGGIGALAMSLVHKCSLLPPSPFTPSILVADKDGHSTGCRHEYTVVCG